MNVVALVTGVTLRVRIHQRWRILVACPATRQPVLADKKI